MHAEFVEFLGMLNREEDHFLKLLFGFLKTTNIFPLDVGHLNVSFSQGGGVDGSHCEFEVLLGNGHGFKDGSVDFLGLDVDDVHLLSDALKGRFGAECCHISADKTVGVFGDCFKINIF